MLPILGRTLFVMICILYYVEAESVSENWTTTVLVETILGLTSLIPDWVIVISEERAVLRFTHVVAVVELWSRTMHDSGVAEVVKGEKVTRRYPFEGKS